MEIADRGLLKLAKPAIRESVFDNNVLDHKLLAEARKHAFTAIQSIRDDTIDAILFVGSDMVREAPDMLIQFPGRQAYLHAPLFTDHDTLARDRALTTEIKIITDLHEPFLSHKHVLVFSSNSIYYITERLALIAAAIARTNAEADIPRSMTVIAIGHVYNIQSSF